MIIISMAISPAFALGEGNRNLLLIGIMGLSPLVILKLKKFYWSDILLWLFLFSITIIPPIVRPESVRWSTIMYSWMFGLTFLAYKQLLALHVFTVKNYMQLLKYLIYAYCIVLLIQQFCVLTGLPIFNLSNYDPSTPWKLNSLGPEPSLSARTVGLLMYCYIVTKELIKNKKYIFHLNIKEDKWIWAAFLWTMVTMGSGTAFVLIAIIFIKFIKIKNILFLIPSIGMLFILLHTVHYAPIDRAYNVLMATLTMDPNTIMKTDLSASVRIVPMMLLAHMVSFTTLDGWFGHGIGFVSTFLYSEMIGVKKGFSAGGLMQFLINYGFVSFFLFILFSFLHSFNKKDYLSIIFWFVLVVMSTINTPMGWLVITLLFTNLYFQKRISIDK